jgi:signal transduction histidine kinase
MRRARNEIMLLLPSERAFIRQEKIGIMNLLVQLAKERGVKVKILAPALSEELRNELSRLREQKLDIRQIKAPKAAAEEEYRTTILTVDEQASIVIELKDDKKETFAEAIGISISTMNKVNVRAFVTLFKSFWEETELRETLYSKTLQLQRTNESLADVTRDLQATTNKLSVAKADLTDLDEKLTAEMEKARLSDLELSEARDTLQVETAKLERNQMALGHSEKNLEMRSEALRLSELTLLESNQKLLTSNKDLAAALKNLAALKKSSKAELEGKDAQIKIADDLLFESNEKLAAANRKLLEVNKELALAYAQLKVNERMQRDFINIAAHELRTPIQPILGAVDLLESGEIESNEGLDIISRNARRAERLAADILNVARIENNLLSLDKSQFNIHSTIMDTVDEQRIIIDREGKGETLKILFDDKTEENLSLYADKEKISEVVSNLVNNAVNHANSGEILVTLERKDNNIVFKVIDSGSGIRQDVEKKLFTKFMTTSPKGMGLGLYISKNIIEVHDGKIWAGNNANGRGATFAFSIPLNRG